VVFPALLSWFLLRGPARNAEGFSSAGVVYLVAVGSLLSCANAMETYLRYGVFAFLVSHVLAGELWDRGKSMFLKPVIYAAFLVMAGANCLYLGGTYLYDYLSKTAWAQPDLISPNKLTICLPAGFLMHPLHIGLTGSWDGTIAMKSSACSVIRPQRILPNMTPTTYF